MKIKHKLKISVSFDMIDSIYTICVMQHKMIINETKVKTLDEVFNIISKITKTKIIWQTK